MAEHGADQLKRRAAEAALDLVRDGMTVGLGTGSTARWFVTGLAERVRSGQVGAVRCVPTSEATAALARDNGLPLVRLGRDGVDLAVDGMDEVDARLDAVKGLGGALLREKIVAAAARQFVLIGHASKVVGRLCEASPLPVEVVPFGRDRTLWLLEDLGATAELRPGQGGEPFVTDNGNLIADCRFPAAFEPRELAAALSVTPGVVEHGLFLDMASRAYLASEQGVEVVRREDR